MKIQLVTLVIFLMAGMTIQSQTMSDYMSNIYTNNSQELKEPVKNKSKAVLIDESFEGDDMPEGWSTYELAENGSWTLNLGLGNTGSHSMKHAQAAAETDNWLVTPQIYLDADNYQVSFYEFASQWEDNSCNILVSSGSGDPADGEFVLELTVPTAGWWIYQIIDLSAYEGDSIYIGFQAITVSAGYSAQWWIDDVYVAPSEFTDGGIILTAPQGYNPNTGMEVIEATIENFGTETITEYDVDWLINGEYQTTYNGTTNISAGNSINVIIGQYDFAEESNYTIEAEIFITDDDDSTNNFSSVLYSVGLSNDLAILSMSPNGNSPFNGSRLMEVEIINNGNSIIYGFDVEWEVNGEVKPNVEITGIDLQPGDKIFLNFEDQYFPVGIHEIWIGIPIDFDLTPEDNEIEDMYIVGGLYEDFQANFPPDQWEVTYSLKSNWYPQNGDPDNFYIETWAGSNTFGSATDTTWTPRLDIEAGDEMTFMANSGTGGNISIVWKDAETGVVSVLESNISLSPYTWEEESVDLSDAEGPNYIGFVNAAGSWGVMNYDDIVSTAPLYTYEYDLALFDQAIEQISITNNSEGMSCRVKNVGEEDIAGSEYTVNLMDVGGGTLETLQGVDINSFESKVFEFNYTFINQGNYNVFLEVEFESDENTENNQGDVQGIHAVPGGTQFPTIGEPGYPGLEFPFNTRGFEGYPHGKDDFSQVIYYSDEIGTPGMIQGVKYYYKNIAAYGSVAPLQVWVAETDITDFDAENWYPQDDFQIVFDDTIVTTGGDGYIYIQFEEPYLYNGSTNLILQHHCYDPSFLFAVSDIWATVSTENLRVNCQNDWHEINLDDLPWPLKKRTDYPYTSFVIDPLDDIGVISGIVYDENNNPAEGAVIWVEGTTVTDTSAADGSYALPPLSFGLLSLRVDKFGYDYAVQEVDLNASTYPLDFYLEPRPQISVSGQVVGSNDNTVGLENATLFLTGYSNYATLSEELGNFAFNNVYGNENYQIQLELYGYETYIDTVELTGGDLDLGTLVMQEEFIPAVNIIATDNDTEALIEWIDPANSQKLYLISDMNEDMGGLANEPNENVWLGNRFENSGEVTLTSVDIFFTFDEGGVPDSVSVDVFDQYGEVIASSEPFITPWYDWVYLDLPNVTITGEYYIMVHWKNLENTTHFLCYDYDWFFNMPNAAYIKYPGEDLTLLGEYFNEEPHFAFWVRAHVLDEGDDKGIESVMSYNVYRGFADEIGNVEGWTQLNLDPVTETNYTDDTWPPIGVNSYMYAVEAIYAEQDAEVTYSNSLEGGIVSVNQESTGYKLFPNPVSGMLEIQAGAPINRIVVFNNMGEKVMELMSSGTSTSRINLEEREPGVYYIQVETVSGISTNKVIKK